MQVDAVFALLISSRRIRESLDAVIRDPRDRAGSQWGARIMQSYPGVSKEARRLTSAAEAKDPYPANRLEMMKKINACRERTCESRVLGGAI